MRPVEFFCLIMLIGILFITVTQTDWKRIQEDKSLDEVKEIPLAEETAPSNTFVPENVKMKCECVTGSTISYPLDVEEEAHPENN